MTSSIVCLQWKTFVADTDKGTNLFQNIKHILKDQTYIHTNQCRYSTGLWVLPMSVFNTTFLSAILFLCNKPEK